ETLTLFRSSGELNGSHRVEGNYKKKKTLYRGNTNQFKEIFWNLIKNALKAMPKGGLLTIDFKKEKRGGIQTKFIDTGKGMSQEEKERLFEPFYSGFENGNGLGMAVVHRIVDEYNGKIQVLSEIYKGTEITINFPGMDLRG
ncbi:ATP-binding protein, partial [Acidobacteriota bacterium]